MFCRYFPVSVICQHISGWYGVGRDVSEVSTTELVVALRDLPPNAAANSGAVRRLRGLWERASTLTRAQAALLAGEGRIPEGTLYDRLPRSIALATLASQEAWTDLDAASAEALASEVLQRLAASGYSTAGITALDVVSAAWLPGPSGPDTHTDQLGRASELVAADPPDRDKLNLAVALTAAARRAWLCERYGLALPAETKAAIAPLSLQEAANQTGVAKATLSRYLNGLRRITDDAALLMLRRLEASSGG